MEKKATSLNIYHLEMNAVYALTYMRSPTRTFITFNMHDISRFLQSSPTNKESPTTSTLNTRLSMTIHLFSLLGLLLKKYQASSFMKGLEK